METKKMIRWMNRTRIVAAVALALLLQSCHHAPASGLPVTTMNISSQTFTIEIATSDADQAIGLMHRDSMDSDHGMIFVNHDEEVRTFWNHDVHFPLDLVFLNASGNIVSMKMMPAWDESSFSSEVPAQFALEFNAGTAKKIGLTVGEHIDIPPAATSAGASHAQ
jgi:uncharacterized membrane protein (UPF0127 family)